MSIALATGGGGTAARDAASARSASRALCGVMVVGSRSGSNGMIWATIGSSGVVMSASPFSPSFRDAPPSGAGPESITPNRGYGFRARRQRPRPGTTVSISMPHQFRHPRRRRGVAAALGANDAVDDGHADPGQVAEPHAVEDVLARR